MGLNRVYTYVIKDRLSGLSKIGRTSDLNKRLSTLSTSNLNLSLFISVDEDREKELHRLFKDKQVKNEWFDFNEKDLEDIKELFGYFKKQEYV